MSHLNHKMIRYQHFIECQTVADGPSDGKCQMVAPSIDIFRHKSTIVPYNGVKINLHKVPRRGVNTRDIDALPTHSGNLWPPSYFFFEDVLVTSVRKYLTAKPIPYFAGKWKVLPLWPFIVTFLTELLTSLWHFWQLGKYISINILISLTSQWRK